jgi:polyhydroxyalkanoate synthesis repressor PhaR
VIVIKKYPNRRLYDTNRSVYVNLDQVAELVRAGHEVQVVDAKDGTDRTKETLLQIVLEVLNGVDLLPIGMLRRMIRAGGSSPAELVMRRQLASGLDLMSAQLDRMEALITPPPPPPPAAPAPSAGGPSAPEGGARKEPEADPELAELRKRLDALERRLSRG